MDKGKRFDWERWGPAALAILAIAIFLYLRMRNLGHLLNWDEARFILYNRAFTGNIENVWGQFINIHPPLYLWICAFLNKAFNGGETSFELVSILFSLGTLLLVGRIAGFLFNRWTGALAMFLLAVIPASTVFDTWIKEDAIAVFFLTLTIYLFLREKYVFGGIALGLGMLSKEIAVFSLLAIGIYALTCWRRDQILGVVKVGLIGAVTSFWWYLFVSSSVGLFSGFFLGTNHESEIWAFPWHFYIAGLPDDLGWCILAAAVVGMAVCFRRRFQGSRVHMLPVAWFLPIYAFISVSSGKPHWMVSSAMPAAAMLAAIGMVESVKWLGGHIPSARLARAAQISLAGALILWALLGAVFTSSTEYNLARVPGFMIQPEASRQDADFIKSTMDQGDKLFLVSIEDPVLVYYLGDIDLASMANIQAADPEDVAAYARALGVDWIYGGRISPFGEELDIFLSKLSEFLPIEASYPGAFYSYLLKVNKAQE